MVIRDVEELLQAHVKSQEAALLVLDWEAPLELEVEVKEIKVDGLGGTT